MKNKAIFLDRDGVMNEMIYNSNKDEYEPPYKIEDLRIIRGVIDALKILQKNDFKLFLISNQPDYAKGKTSLESLTEVHEEIHKIFVKNEIYFNDYYYCYHHPEGIIPEYSINCECRKPKTFFVDIAVSKFEIDKGGSWFIGDRDSDIECGKNSGLKTILIGTNYYKNTNKVKPDFIARDLKEASEIVNSK